MINNLVRFTADKLWIVGARAVYSTLEGWTFVFSRHGIATLIGAELLISIKDNGIKRFSSIFTTTAIALVVSRSVYVFFRPGAPWSQAQKDAAAETLQSIWDWQPEDSDSFDSGAWNILRQLVVTINELKSKDGHAIADLLADPKLQGHELVSRLYYMYASNAFSCLPSADNQTSSKTMKDSVPLELLQGFEHYRKYAYMTYDATDNVITAQMLRENGFDLLSAQYEANIVPSGCPAFFLAYSKKKNELMLCVRGTFSAADAFTDLLASGVAIAEGKEEFVHSGMQSAAEYLFQKFGDLFTTMDKAGTKISLVGHSLGAGVNALLALMLKTQYKLNNMTCWGFCTPPCMDLPLATSCANYVNSLVIDDDVVPRLGTGPFAGLLTKLIEFDPDKAAAELGVPAGLTVLKHLDSLFEKFNSKTSSSTEAPLSSGDKKVLEKAVADGLSQFYDPCVPGTIVYLQGCSLNANPEAANTQWHARVRRIQQMDPELRCIKLSPSMITDHFIDRPRLIAALEQLSLQTAD